MSRADREAAHERAMLQGRHLETAIRERMPAAGVRSISELARRSGVQRDTLYAWFRGHPPKPVTLQRIADVLAVPLGDLWDYETHGPPPSLSPAQAAEIRAVVAEAVASAFDARLERIERLLGDLAGDRAPARRPPARRP